MTGEVKRYLAAAFVGASVFAAIGYIGYGAASGADGGFDFWYWLTSRPLERGSLYWAVMGGLVGAATRYASRPA